MAKTVAGHLRNFISLQISYVTTETLKALKNILRRYPDFIEDFIPFINPKLALEVQDVDGKVALCWLLGMFGHYIEDAPYMLEKMIEDIKELQSAELSQVLLAATFRLFFKRAPETKKILANVFQEIMVNCMDSHVKQRAVFLYRLLKSDQQQAKQIAESESGEFEEFFEDKNDESRERLFWEFNSLSVVYQRPSERFLKDTVLKQAQASEKKYFPERRRKIKTQEDDDENQAEESNVQPLIAHATKPVVSVAVTQGNLLDDLLDLGGSGATIVSTNQTSSVFNDDLLGGFGQ